MQPWSYVLIERIVDSIFANLVALLSISLGDLAVLHKLLGKSTLDKQNIVSANTVSNALSDELVCMVLLEVVEVFHEHIA